MIVVFDTGVWVSALHFGGTPLAALDKVLLRGELAICEQIVMEIRTVLVSRFGWDDGEVGDLLDEYLSEAVTVRVDGTIKGICRDAKDDMVLECAVNAQADLIVTGDNDLLSLGLFREIRIVTPRSYLADLFIN